ncbi:MAG: alpha/beta hydrolase-fold protein [Bacteroidota bacterium]
MITDNRPFLLFCLLILIVACQQDEPQNIGPVSPNRGTVIRLDTIHSKYVKDRNIDVWLPQGYVDLDEYQVLYMHDGQMLFDTSITWNQQAWHIDEAVQQLFEENKIPPTIVVGIWNTDRRHAEYFPQKPFEQLPASSQQKLSGEIQSDNYLRYIVEEVKPVIDAQFSTKPAAQHTFIGGSSMGGLISMYALCEYPDIFGGAMCLSSHWIGFGPEAPNPIPQAFVDYLAAALPDPSLHKVYFDFGTETLDQYYEPYQLRIDSVMIARDYDNRLWKTAKFPGADHSEKSWTKRLPIPLTFVLSSTPL